MTADRKTPKERRLEREAEEAEKQAALAAANPPPAPAPTEPAAAFTIEFWEDENGKKPVLDWIKEGLSPTQRRALGSAMRNVLQVHGIDVCADHWGKPVATNIAEFRMDMTGEEVVKAGWATEGQVDESEIVFLRVLFHAHGNKILLLLEGYDKGADVSKSTQNARIATAKKRLAAFKQQAILKKQAKKVGA